MLGVKDLPLPSWQYDAFRVKVNQLTLLKERGYDLGPEDDLVDDNLTFKDRFELFETLFEHEDGTPLESLKDLSGIIYTHPASNTVIETYIMEPNELDPLLKSIMEKRSAKPGPRPIKYLMCITTQPAEYSTVLSGVNLWLLHYYKLAVDVRTHYYAPAGVEILSEDEKTALFNSPQMRGYALQSISRDDTMGIFRGLEPGDVIRIKREGIYIGQKLMSIGYRQVK